MVRLLVCVGQFAAIFRPPLPTYWRGVSKRPERDCGAVSGIMCQSGDPIGKKKTPAGLAPCGGFKCCLDNGYAEPLLR